MSTMPIYVAVVDDDESVCRSFGRLLRAAGIQPITYPSAESFLADTKHPQFGCLVLDIQLGGMSGIELGQRLVADGGHTPIIFITAHDEPEARAGAKLRAARLISARPIPVPKCWKPSGGWSESTARNENRTIPHLTRMCRRCRRHGTGCRSSGKWPGSPEASF